MSRYILPKADGPHGHTTKQVNRICRSVGVDPRKFWRHFGVNTAATDKNTGLTNWYTCDIERTLYKLGAKGGQNHEWD